MCADKTWVVFYRLAPNYLLARVLRRDCGSGADLGVVIERPVLLAPLARYPGDGRGLINGVRTGSPANRQGSASGKRTQGYPGPPWRFPPISYPRAGSISIAQGSPCAGRRLSKSSRNRFRTAPVHKPTCAQAQVRRQAFFSFGPSTARFLFGKIEKKMGGGIPRRSPHPPSDPDVLTQSPLVSREKSSPPAAPAAGHPHSR